MMETILKKKTKAFQADDCGRGCEKHTVIYVEPDQEQESQGTQGDQDSPAVPPAVPESLEMNVSTQDSLV